MRKIIFFIALCISCSKRTNIKVSTTDSNKPHVEFLIESFRKPVVVTDDVCYLQKSKDIPVVCMLLPEFDKDIANYKIMLDILKKYIILNEYYKNIN